MFNIGPLELLMVLIIALIVLGPQRLPEVARSVGRGLREFRGALDREDDEDEHDGAPAGPQAAAIEDPAKAPAVAEPPTAPEPPAEPAPAAQDAAASTAGNEGGPEPTPSP